MKSFLAFIRKYQILLSVVVIMAVLIFLRTRGGEELVFEDPVREVQLIPVASALSDMSISLTGTLEAQQSLVLRPEVSGIVSRVLVSEGDTVSRGEMLVSLQNASQSVSLDQARSLLTQAQSVLNELLGNRNGSSDSDFARLVDQQDQIVQSAYQSLLNASLEAYSDNPVDDEDSPAPTISGFYTSDEEGEYRITVYPSKTDSGASFRYEGLETGTTVATVNQSVPLGTRGLYIQFPVGFEKTYEWIVSIPNTRGSGYLAARSAYESALEGRDVVLGQSDADPFKIERQEASVQSARLSVEQARVALEKTIIRAPFDGVVTRLDVDSGDLVSATQDVGSLKNLDTFEVVVYISESLRDRVDVDSPVFIEDSVEGYVIFVGQDLDPATRKVKVRISVPDSDFVEGQSLSLVLPLLPGESGGISLPLSALSVVGTQMFVYVVEDGVVHRIPVTIGTVFGRDVEILDGLSGVDFVVRDARGLQDGMVVEEVL